MAVTQITADTRKRLSLLAAILGSFVALLDSTVVNVALPAIEQDLGGGLAGQQWVVNAYLLVLGSLILVGGRLGDVYGERTVFSIGVAGFGVASLLCALAPSIEVLVGARALQGAFGALLTPSALAVIVATFGPDERGAAIGSWTAWTGIAAVAGPLAGGQMIVVASWRWIFAINVPFVIATLALVVIAVPARALGEERRSVDWLGGLLCALGLAGPVYALIRQPDLGWGAPGVMLPLLGGFALLALFLLHEARTRDPMLPLSLFRRRNFAVGNAETLAMYAGLSVLFFFLILFLQQVAGWTALEAGLTTLPTTVIMFLLSRRTGKLADRYGPRLFMGGGPLVAAAGLLLLLRVDANPDYVTDLLPALVVFAVGLTRATPGSRPGSTTRSRAWPDSSASRRSARSSRRSSPRRSTPSWTSGRSARGPRPPSSRRASRRWSARSRPGCRRDSARSSPTRLRTRPWRRSTSASASRRGSWRPAACSASWGS